MKAIKPAAMTLRGYVLHEEQYRKLEQLRDQLFLMAKVIYASTEEEEDVLLEVRRSNLGQLLEDFGLRVDEVVTALQCEGHRLQTPSQWH
ncbi:XAC0095 family protein [Dyella mobilis]|uniref:XAC0095-like domain-containing protein n=1 Tax=Dyella mobilis TaxID=1849582 RepID=A0ABS2KEU8_9GAMM|nr:hypothetical protein [Dyella mobilis]MBM7129282.1 hypothetical protein [Dyella mobilis]GLQ98574.1 hypothetical protein GCM10007863_29940 [Dyella mobilis]